MLNSFYYQENVLNAIKKTFAVQKSVALVDIVDHKTFDQLKKLKGWKREIIPDQYSYESHPDVSVQDEIKDFVRLVTGKHPHREKNRRFSHRDYTILHDHDTQSPGIIALLFLDDWNEEWGGKIVFMKNGQTLSTFIPRKNTLLIVERKKGEKYFVKYVNQKGGKKRLAVFSG